MATQARIMIIGIQCTFHILPQEELSVGCCTKDILFILYIITPLVGQQCV